MKKRYMCLLSTKNREKYKLVNDPFCDYLIYFSDKLDQVYLIAGFDKALKKGYIPISQEEFIKKFPPNE